MASAAGALALSAVAVAPADASTRHRVDGDTFMRQLAQQGTQRWHWHPKPPDGTPVVIASGLANPRQLTLTLDNKLLIAEAGDGAGVGADPASCLNDPEAGSICIGATGAISSIRNPSHVATPSSQRIVTGLPSAAGPDGSFATGPDGVGGLFSGRVYAALTYAPPEALPPGTPGADLLGKLVSVRPGGAPSVRADISAYEIANDPDGQGPDSNPYGVLDLGTRVLVADAAANTVFSVDLRGRVSVFAVLPTITTGVCGDAVDNNGDGVPDTNEDGTFSCDPVPTSLALAPDGNVLVGGLVSEAPGEGRVWKLSRSSGAILKTWTGFSGVVGVAADLRGNVYVSELFGGAAGPEDIPGQLTKVSPSGARSSVKVPFSGGVAADWFGHVYVGAWSTSSSQGSFGPGTQGQVWRLNAASFG